jgi:hypothetical protein
VNFVLLSGDRLYTHADNTLYVYSMSDFTSPIATYHLKGYCCSGLIADNRIFLGICDYSSCSLHVYEIRTSITEPLEELSSIRTNGDVIKMIKVGQEIMLGERNGYLEIYDIEKF